MDFQKIAIFTIDNYTNILCNFILTLVHSINHIIGNAEVSLASFHQQSAKSDENYHCKRRWTNEILSKLQTSGCNHSKSNFWWAEKR